MYHFSNVNFNNGLILLSDELNSQIDHVNFIRSCQLMGQIVYNRTKQEFAKVKTFN